MRRGAPPSPPTWPWALVLGAFAAALLTAAAPQAQARRPKARGDVQASDRGSAERHRAGRRSARRARKSKSKGRAKARAGKSASVREGKRVGKTGLVRLKYTVKRGDTLSRVARKLHVTVDQLRWWNRWLRKGSTLRVGARIAYLVDQATLDRREAERRKAARAKARARTHDKGHRRAAKVAREALVKAGDAREDATPRRASKDVRALRTAHATREELGKAAKPSGQAPSEAPRGGNPDASQDPAPADRAAQPGQPAQVGAPLAPAEDAGPRGAVAKVAGAAREVVATVAATDDSTARAGRAGPKTSHEASDTRRAKEQASGKRRETAGDFPSYRVPARDKRAEAIGSPNKGRLLHGVEMPIRGRGFRRVSTKKRFATDQTIALIRYAAARLAAQFPGTQPMLVNALSAKGGGRVRPHHSHQNGLDVDILYFQKGNPKHPKRGNLRPAEIDYVKTWFVLETLLLTGKFNYAFTDRSFIPGLRRQARRAGWTKRALRKIFGDPSGKGRKGLIRHWSGHRDHIHIRFTCHPADKRCEHSHFY